MGQFLESIIRIYSMSGSVCAAGHEGMPNHCLFVSVLTKSRRGLKSAGAYLILLLISIFYIHVVYNDFN